MMAYWITAILLFGAILSSAWLETGLALIHYLEFAFLIAAIASTVVFLWAVADEYAWSWRLGLVIFALLLANSVYVYTLTTEKMLAFLLVVLCSVAGILVCLLGTVEYEVEMPEAPKSVKNNRGKSRK